MKKMILIFLILPLLDAQSQSIQIKNLVNLDSDSFCPSILGWPNASYGTHLFFNIKTDSIINIYAYNYATNNDSFNNLTKLTDNNFLNINFTLKELSPGDKVIIWQTNENGNYDVAFRAYAGTQWTLKQYLLNSPQDEINPSFATRGKVGETGIEIVYQKNNSVYFHYYDIFGTKDQIIFQTEDNAKYSIPTGSVETYDQKTRGYIAAIQEKQSEYPKIVYKFKNFNDTLWGDTKVVFDSGFCSNPKFFERVLSFESVINNKKQVYFFSSPNDFGKNYLANRLNTDTSFETSNVSVFLLNKYTGAANVFSSPHTYKLKRGDSNFVYVVGGTRGNLKDSLIYVKYPDSKPTVGAVEYQNGFYKLITYTVWEDSSDGKLALFGVRREDTYGTIGVDDDNLTKPNDFKLFQNYPNPFNPKTIIKYSIVDGPWRMNNVQVKVFDLLGREVATLVNEQKLAGEYEVEFDAQKYGLSTGVYFYRLTAGSFTSTKKLIYLR